MLGKAIYEKIQENKQAKIEKAIATGESKVINALTNLAKASKGGITVEKAIEQYKAQKEGEKMDERSQRDKDFEKELDEASEPLIKRDEDIETRLEQLKANVTELKTIIKTHTERLERLDEFFRQWEEVLQETHDRRKEKRGKDYGN